MWFGHRELPQRHKEHGFSPQRDLTANLPVGRQGRKDARFFFVVLSVFVGNSFHRREQEMQRFAERFTRKDARLLFVKLCVLVGNSLIPKNYEAARKFSAALLPSVVLCGLKVIPALIFAPCKRSASSAADS